MAKEKDAKKTDAAQESKAAPKSRGESSNKMFVLMFAGVMIIQMVIIVVAVFFFLNKGSSSPAVESTEKQTSKENVKPGDKKKVETKTEDEEKLPEKPASWNSGDIIVNPKESGGKRYLMTKISLLYDSKEKELDKDLKDNREGQLSAVITQYLSSKTVDELSNINIRDSLSVELKNRINEELGSDKIKKVYFSKFVIQ